MVLAVGTPLRLNTANLALLAERAVDVPGYDRTALEPQIVHVGVGGFHRAHLARYTDELAEAGGTWGIRGLGLLSGDAAMADALGSQDHLYTLIERASDGATVRVVGSIIDYRWCAEQPAGAAALLADPAVAIISLTITEAGYSLDDGPNDTFDVLAAGLDRRRHTSAGGVAVLSCDNLPGNGAATRAVTLAAAQRRDPALGTWIEAECSFPSSMVDRITPTTKDADRQWLRDSVGIDDHWPVVAEPFRQWVVEDSFVAGRPAWEDVGVLFSDRVHDWELYKLRMLNAAHSSMAYLCALDGITFVDEAMAMPAVAGFLTDLLAHEAVPSLRAIDGHPREEYAATVLERFANTGVRDQIARLCIDGTAKFPTFLVPTVEHQLAAGGPIGHATLALAGWGRYLATVPPTDQAVDASGDIARAHARRALADPRAFLQLDAVFTPALADSERFRGAFVDAWRRIEEHGPVGAMAAAG